MSADAWLRSEEGIAWSLSQTPSAYGLTSTPTHLYQHGPGDVSEDPTGRPPVKGPALIAATGGEAA